MTVDDLLGIDGFVTHGGVDVAVTGDQLGDVRWHAMQDGVGDEQPAEVVRGEPEGLARDAGEACPEDGQVEELPDGLSGDRPVFGAQVPLEEKRHGRIPQVFVVVPGNDQGDGSVIGADAADDRAQHIGQFRADHQQPFGVGLGRDDVQ